MSAAFRFQHAFWLYGVLVGLSITHALNFAIPEIFAPRSDPPIDPVQLSVRLFVFLTVIVRFYLGSATFFEAAYSQPEAAEKYPKKSFGLDFLFGFIHFVFFFAWAASLDLTSQSPRLFFALLMAILLYDTLWFLACRENDTRRLMKVWTFINFLTVVFALVPYWGIQVSGGSPLVAEYVAYLVVLFVSIVDLVELARSKSVFKDWLGQVIS